MGLVLHVKLRKEGSDDEDRTMPTRDEEGGTTTTKKGGSTRHEVIDTVQRALFC